MIAHTLIFSFGDGRTQAEQDKFLARVADISLKSGLCTRAETRKHLPLANDAYAPVFVASAVAQLFCPNLEAVDELSGAEALVPFERREQQRSPYGVVWANTEPLTPVADA
jgi:hypothetical protein